MDSVIAGNSVMSLIFHWFRFCFHHLYVQLAISLDFKAVFRFRENSCEKYSGWLFTFVRFDFSLFMIRCKETMFGWNKWITYLLESFALINRITQFDFMEFQQYFYQKNFLQFFSRKDHVHCIRLADRFLSFELHVVVHFWSLFSTPAIHEWFTFVYACNMWWWK